MNETKATPRATMPDYWERGARLPFQDIKLLGPRSTPTLLLTATECATVRVTAPDIDDLPEGSSVLHEAQFRLSVMQQRGILQTTSGHRLAQIFQLVLWPDHPAKLGYRGWGLLRTLDEADMVKIWLDAEPLPGSHRFRPMRMRDRIAELSQK